MNSARFSRLRRQLDDAITYGSKKQARAVAHKGLEEARSRGDAGEAEYFLAQKHIIKEEFARAIEHLDEAIRRNPRDGAAFNDRALCMVELGIIDEALVYFDRGIAAEADYATIYHNKGWLLNNIGRHTEAVSCFRQALRLERRRPVTYDNLADALLNLGDLKGAAEAYRKVLRYLKPGQARGMRGAIRAQLRAIEEKL